MAAVGGFRVVKACKFLPEFGWQPVVLTVKEGFNYAYDYSMLEKLPPELKVIRTRYFSPLMWWDERSQPQTATSQKSDSSTSSGEKGASPETNSGSMIGRSKQFVRNLISIPDSHNFWVPFATAAGLKAIHREKIDAILTTSPPASTHLIGCKLSWLTGRPLVVDYRDLWTQNEGYHLRKFSSGLRGIDRWLEKRVLKRASAIVTATDEFSELVRENNRYKRPELIATITNGIDPNDFKDIEFPDKKNEKFTLLHLGSLYGNRNPEFFFKALGAWLERRPEAVPKTSVLFYGNTPGYESMLKGSPLEQVVEFRGHVPQHEILPMLWRSDMLLLILGFHPGGAGVMPAKLFEYICTGRPILAFVPEGVAAKVIREHKRGTPVTGEDIESTVQALDVEFSAWQERSGPPPSSFQLPEAFDRRIQNKKLAEILHSIV